MKQSDYREQVLEYGVPILFDSDRDVDAALDTLCRSMRSDELRFAVMNGRFWYGSSRVVMMPDVKLAEKFGAELEKLAEKDEEHAEAAVELAEEVAGAIENFRESCERSPCSSLEELEKVKPERLEEARQEVGTPKKKVKRPRHNDPLAVSYGLGVDSTAVLVGFAQLVAEGYEEFRPDVIVLSDVGSEKDESYAYLKKMNAFLRSVGFPEVTIVAWATGFVAKSWGSSRTLEQQCINNQTMPSISASKFGRSACSVLWKQAAMNRWFETQSGFFQPKKSRRGYELPRGKRIVKAIGYDSDETNREKAGTFRVKEEMAKEKELGRQQNWEYWYPLQDWGWDRARCIAEIEEAISSAPPKSSCTYCGAMRRPEVRALPKADLTRALLIEQVAMRGRHKQTWGLGASWRWSDFALEEGLVTQRELDKVVSDAKEIVRIAPKKKGVRDNADHPFIQKLPAFSQVKGFRGKRLPMLWDRSDALEEAAEAE
jgi:hypothetical protein